jgi:putative oxidoreductase
MNFLRYLSRYEDEAFAILRIVAGFLFLWHGTQKYFNYPPLPPGVVVPLFVVYVGGTIEFIGGILVMIGLGTRWAAFLASGEMAYAYWMMHGHHALLPLVNQGEIAFLYCFVFLFICIRGAGIWSVDALIKRHVSTK